MFNCDFSMFCIIQSFHMEDIIVGIGDAAGNGMPDFLDVSWSQTRSQINNENIKYINSDTENKSRRRGSIFCGRVVETKGKRPH